MKFAKFIPEENRMSSDFKFVHDLIEQVRLDYEFKMAELAKKENEKEAVMMEEGDE